MAKFILRRVIRGIIALLLFQTLLFALVHALPYDFSAFVLGSPQLRNFIQRQFDLDLPLWRQYVNWLFRFLRFDLGESYQHWPMSVTELLASRLSKTLLLFLSATLLAYGIGIWLGKIIAWNRGSKLEFVVTLGGIAAYTSFAPWMGFLLINVFGWYLDWLPYQRIVDHNVWAGASISVQTLLGYLVVTSALACGALWLLRTVTRRIRSFKTRWGLRLVGMSIIALAVWGWWAQSGLSYLAKDILLHLTLPLTAVTLLSFGETMMLMRTSMLETMGEKYVLLARAKGLSEKAIRDRHVARNAILPVLTRLMLNLPFVLVGSLAIERVFMWQALGQSIFDAIDYQDIPVLMGVLSIVGILVLVAHLVLDVLYVYLDPRVRHAQGG